MLRNIIRQLIYEETFGDVCPDKPWVQLHINQYNEYEEYEDKIFKLMDICKNPKNDKQRNYTYNIEYRKSYTELCHLDYYLRTERKYIYANINDKSPAEIQKLQILAQRGFDKINKDVIKNLVRLYDELVSD